MNQYYKQKEQESTEMTALSMKLVKWLVIASILLLAAKGALGADLVQEMPVIKPAAVRNGIAYGSDDFYLLLAIRLVENGKHGREFGIINPKANTLDLQAAWCAATIVKHHKRSGMNGVTPAFIKSLGLRYCPPTAHELNRNWEKNVTFWFNKLKGK